MSKKIGRGALAALAAGALALTLGASAASADVIDSDNPIISVPEATVGKATLHRIADADRILTAVKASKSANWGNLNYTANPYVWSCSDTIHPAHGRPAFRPLNTVRHLPLPFPNLGQFVTCTVVSDGGVTTGQMDIIVSRADDYPDALAAAPLADVLDAPILLHPTGLVDRDSRPTHTDMGLHPAVEAEIARLANLGSQSGTHVTVHLLGGTGALSHAVENAIDNISGVDVTVRHQGTNRFQTATTIANTTVGFYGIEAGASTRDINVYLTTGVNFPDALSAGAAAANNDGVVLLTNHEGWDTQNYTRDYLTNLRNVVVDELPWIRNTSEVFAVGGPARNAAAGPDGVSLADAYVGVNRYATAAITAQATFDNPSHFAIVSGENFPDALVGSGFIANADGPLLLTQHASLDNYTADYLKDNGKGFVPPVPNVSNGDTIVVFGGGGSVSQQVSADVKALLDGLFAQPNW